MATFFELTIGLSLFFVLLFISKFLFQYFEGGALDDFIVGIGEPPVDKFVGFYKLGTEEYTNSTDIFKEAKALAPSLYTFGIYYGRAESRRHIGVNGVRWIAGSLVPKSMMNEPEFEEEKRRLRNRDYKIFEFPQVYSAVLAVLPFYNELSPVLGSHRAYARLTNCIKEHRLSAYPLVELHEGNNIIYFAPLEKNLEFFTPEIDPRLRRPPHLVEENLDN